MRKYEVSKIDINKDNKFNNVNDINGFVQAVISLNEDAIISIGEIVPVTFFLCDDYVNVIMLDYSSVENKKKSNSDMFYFAKEFGAKGICFVFNSWMSYHNPENVISVKPSEDPNKIEALIAYGIWYDEKVSFLMTQIYRDENNNIVRLMRNDNFFKDINLDFTMI